MDLQCILSLGILMTIAVEAQNIDDLEFALRTVYRASKLEQNGTIVILVGSTGNHSFSEYLLQNSESKNCDSLEPRELTVRTEPDEATGVHLVDLAHFQDASPESAMVTGFYVKQLMEAGREFKIVVVEKKRSYFGGSLFQSLGVAANLMGTNLGPFRDSVALVLTDCVADDFLEDDTLDYTKRLESLYRDLKAMEGESEKSRKDPLRVSPLLKHLMGEKRVHLDTVDTSMTQEYVFDTLKPSSPTPHRPTFSALYGRDSVLHPLLLKKTISALENEFDKLRTPLLRPLDAVTGASVQPLQRKIASVITFSKDHLRLLGRIRTVEQLAMLARKNGVADVDEIYFQMAKLSFLLGKRSRALVENSLDQFMSSLVQQVTSERDAYSNLQGMIGVANSYEAQSFFWNGPADEKPQWIHQTQIAALNVTKSDGDAFKTHINDLWFSNNVIKIKGATVTFSGRFVVLSTLKEAIEAVVGEVVLIATDTIFIDCDLNLQHALLRLVAPTVEVVGPGNLELHFQSGDKRLSCVQGPGASAFSLVTMDIHNGDSLNVTTPGVDNNDECTRYDWRNVRITTAEYNKKILGNFLKHYKCKRACVFEFKVAREQLLQSISSNQATPRSNADDNALSTLDQLILEKGFGREITIVHPKATFDATRICPYKEFSPMFSSRDLIVIGGMPSGVISFSDAKNLVYRQAGAQKNFRKGAMLDQAFDYYEAITRENIVIQSSPESGKFLRLLLTSKKVIETFSNQDFTAMIEFSEVNVAATTQAQKTCSIQSLHFLYTSMLEGVTNWRLAHSAEGAASVAEYALLSLLETLDALLHGKQVVRLAALVDAQLVRLTDVNKAMESVAKFETIATEKQFFLDKIAAAEKLMANIQNRKLEEQKKQSEEEFAALLYKTEQMKTLYEETDERLIEHKRKVEVNMWKNVGLGIVNTVTMAVGSIFPPVAYIGPVVSGVVNAVAPGPGELRYESRVAKAVQNSKSVFRHFEAQRDAKQKNLVAAVHRILEKDSTHSFLKEESRLKLDNLVQQIEDGNDDDELDDLEDLFDDVEEALDETEKALEKYMDGDYSGAMEALDTVKGSVEVARHVAAAAVAATKAVNQYFNDRAKIDQVDSVIDKNRQNLQELMEYERDVERTFKPMMEQMVQSFDSMGTGLKSQEEFERLFQKLDLKSHVRKCISTVQRLTQDFFEKDEGFTVILTELQELLSVLMEAFDKIEELRYRTRLSEFIGRMSGVKCNDAACNALEKMAAGVKTNELVRELALVLAAYRQTSFPFGAAKMRALSATRLKLVNATRLALISGPREDVVKLLQSALDIIKTDLADKSYATENKHDSVLIEGSFASGLETSYPFFVWPKEHYSGQIAQLLSGKPVTMEASASHPDVKNAAKFTRVALQFNSTDPEVSKRVNELLKKFRLEMTRGAESYFRCGASVYAMDGSELNMTMSFERDARGDEVAQNKVRQKVTEGDVPLSPYALWKLQLRYAARSDSRPVFQELAQLANKVDLELVGKGYYVQEGAAICRSDLSGAYDLVGHVDIMRSSVLRHF